MPLSTPQSAETLSFRTSVEENCEINPLLPALQSLLVYHSYVIVTVLDELNNTNIHVFVI